MLKRLYILLITLSLLLPCALSAHGAERKTDLSGEYTVKGWEPGSDTKKAPDYEGVVVIKPYGPSWMYHGVMDGQSYLGVGIYDEDTKKLSLSFTNTSKTENGVTVLSYKNGKLIGQWVYFGYADGMHGKEIWIKH